MIEQQLRDAREGIGSVVVLEGPAGKGKSRLLELAADLARSQGLRVLGASGTELERHFPFGIAIQLFEPWWLAADDSERAAASSGAARAAGALLEQGPGARRVRRGVCDRPRAVPAHRAAGRRAPPSDEPLRPLVMLVDDAQWADGPSLRFLAYLAERLADLPIALVVSMRPGEPGADAEGLGALTGRRRRLGCCACSRSRCAAVQQVVTGGVSRGRRCLLRRLRPDHRGQSVSVAGAARAGARRRSRADRGTAGRLGDLAPDAVLDTMVARLGAMPAPVRSVALAVAVLGDGTALRHVAELTRYGPGEAAHGGRCARRDAPALRR